MFRLFFVFYCLFIAQNSLAQFFIAEGSSLVAESATVVISTQETQNIFNGAISGQGTLVLSGVEQRLTSTASNFLLSNLIIAAANSVVINSQLQIANTLEIQQGTLLLSHKLILKNKEALILGKEAAVLAAGLLYFDLPQSLYSFSLATIAGQSPRHLKITAPYTRVPCVLLQEKVPVYFLDFAIFCSNDQEILVPPPKNLRLS